MVLEMPIIFICLIRLPCYVSSNRVLQYLQITVHIALDT